MLSVTARGATALLIAMALVLLATPWAIQWLRKLKARQSIREDAPQTHQTKAGTPTMGGLVMLAALVTATLAVAGWNVLTGPALAVTLLFGAIGFVDDLLIARRGKNLGLRAREKMVLQLLCAALFVFFVRRVLPPLPLNVAPWLGFAPLGLVPSSVLDVLFLVGLANAVNFSDGLDGLAAGLTAIAAVVVVLLLPPGMQGSLGVFVLAVAGACLGFLWYNGNPARIFMGDTGSLALGGALGAVAVITNLEVLFLVLGGVYWMELLSVVIQVAYFKRTGRRVFRMSPIHHHFELSGWSEPRIVTRFWLMGAAFGGVALLIAGW
ncbi:MAG: phospho-N-acetylmuramoyl-pentapeptide-transferase [Armatimonadota bacterium]|nr:phospho-N-acetylmuramoyl-pentapeptide-transferase [Armatimonadota bacterium]